MTRVLVTGATGTHGGAVSRTLVAAGHQVAALVRDVGNDRALALRSIGVALVEGDLTDERSLERAFSSQEAIYAVTTPFADGPAGEVRQGEAILAAAEAVGTPWLILASVAAAERAPVPHFQSKARIESALRRTGLAWTVVAPSEHLRARVEVAGDDPTPVAMADALGTRFREIPLMAIAERSPDLAAMYQFLADEGYGIDVAALRARYPEVGWMTFAEWAAAEGAR